MTLLSSLRACYRVALACIVLTAAVVSPCRGDLILRLAFDDASTSKSVLSGTPLLIDMFLVDTDASTFMIAEGLVDGAGSVTQSSGSALLTSTGVFVGSNGSGAWAAAGLDDATAAGTLASGSVGADAPLFAVGQGATDIHLFRFGFTVTGAIGESATLTPITHTATQFPNTTAGPAFQDLDAILNSPSGSFGSIGVNIVAVPEPSTMLIAPFLIALIQICYRQRPRSSIRALHV